MYEKLLNYALFLLSRQKYTEKKIIEKFVKRFNASEEDIQKTISRLKELHLIDDNDFVKSYVSSRNKISPRGKKVLKYELSKKGIKQNIFEKNWEELEINEENSCKNALIKYERKKKNIDKQKKAAFLFRRGFSYETIKKCLNL